MTKAHSKFTKTNKIVNENKKNKSSVKISVSTIILFNNLKITLSSFSHPMLFQT